MITFSVYLGLLLGTILVGCTLIEIHVRKEFRRRRAQMREENTRPLIDDLVCLCGNDLHLPAPLGHWSDCPMYRHG